MPVCCGVFENYVSERISKAERIASDSWEGQEVSQRHAEVFNLLVKGLSEAQKKLLMEFDSLTGHQLELNMRSSYLLGLKDSVEGLGND